MNAFPHASASGNIHIGTIAGKLNGVMPTATPSGWRSECESTPVPTASDASPLSRCAAPQANSTTSRPRWTSPRASSTVLPCSAVIARGELARARRDELAEAEQHVRAARERLRAPDLEAGRRGRHRAVDVGAARERHAPRDGAGGGIGHLADSAPRPAGARPRSSGRRSRARWWSCTDPGMLVIQSRTHWGRRGRVTRRQSPLAGRPAAGGRARHRHRQRCVQAAAGPRAAPGDRSSCSTSARSRSWTRPGSG